MDVILNPDKRKWIAGPVVLNVEIQKVREAIRMQRSQLFVVDPVSSRFPEAAGREFQGHGVNSVDTNELENDSVGGHGERASSAASGVPQADNKWTASDEACEAAVSHVGGETFFLFGKKQTATGEKKQRGRKTKTGKKKEAEEEEASDDAIDPGEGNNVSMYERYNEEVRKISAKREESKFVNPSSLDHVITAAGLDETDSEDDQWFDYDPVTDGAARNAHLMDDNREQGLNDSEESDREDRRRMVDSGDEAEFHREADESGTVYLPGESAIVADGQVPCCSKTVPLTQLPEAPQILEANSQTREFQELVQTIDNQSEEANMKERNMATKPGDGNGKGTIPEKEATREPLAEFKKFTDWVFDLNTNRDKNKITEIRPKLAQAMNVSEKLVGEFQKSTSSSLTSVKGEVFLDEPVMESSSMPSLAPPAPVTARHSLQSLAIFLTHGEDPSCFPWKSINVQQQMNDDFLNHEYKKRMETQDRDVRNPSLKWNLVNKEEDFLVQMLIYQATDPDEVLPEEVKMYTEPRLAYEIHMLGSQTVRDLMGAFHCENDYLCLKDIPHPDSYREKETQENFAKAYFPNSMILIHDTIYTKPDCNIDYAAVINEWASKPPRKNLGPFKRGDWNTQLKDLKLSFGYPYVYIHLGGCEHIYVFTKARLLHVEDHHLKSNYPHIVGQTRFKNTYCRVDNEYLARWAVVDFKELPENPMLLCTECVHMYCYDKYKKKRGDFKLFPFTQMANIL